MMNRRAVALVACASVVACGSAVACSGSTAATSSRGAGSSSSASTTSSGTGGAGPVGGDRPVSVFVPASYEHGTPVPLVMMLHGYTSTASQEESYLQITPLAQSMGFIYAKPNGTTDPTGSQFWNADDACCNLYGSTVDDSAYLSSVITEIEARYTIDPKRVFIVGHSNGGFMAYRMACDHADQIAAIASLAGAMPLDDSVCKPTQPVAILEIHGTADTTIYYDGGAIGTNAYPGATTTVADWVTLDGCSTTPDTSSPPLTLDSMLPPNQTNVTKYAGCKTGGHGELWSIVGGGHIPFLSTSFTPDVIQFLLAHPRP